MFLRAKGQSASASPGGAYYPTRTNLARHPHAHSGAMIMADDFALSRNGHVVSQVKKLAALYMNASICDQPKLNELMHRKLLKSCSVPVVRVPDGPLIDDLVTFSGVRDSLRDGDVPSNYIDDLVEDQLDQELTKNVSLSE